MLTRTELIPGCTALIAAGLLGSTAATADTGWSIDLEDGHSRLRLGNAVTVGTYQRAGRVNSLYGPAFSTGLTPTASAEAFLTANAGLLRTEVEDLAPIGPFPDGGHLVRSGYDRDTGDFKHVIVGYSQFRDEIPVFRAAVKLIVLNQPGYPLILVNSAIRDLGNFRPNIANLPDADETLRAAEKSIPKLDRFDQGGLVIWAGVDDVDAEPVLAREFIGATGTATSPDYRKWLLIVDARTGELLYSEDQVLHADIIGSTSGVITEGLAADVCGPEAPIALPYMQVEVVGGNDTFSDVNGDFVIPHGGLGPVTVRSGMRGQFFEVFVQQGSPDTIDLPITPPGPAHFVHNGVNDQEFIRSQANAYYHANLIRDTVLFYNPDFPVIGDQVFFDINVNIANTCNAFYDGASINFYATGGGCPNSAFSTVVHHEYGHHLVNVTNSGQGQYGEGYGDVMGVFLTDDPGLGYGFNGICADPLRDARAGLQYPCEGAIHDCGQLISGCVWDTREALAITEPADYLDVLGHMIFNAMPMHAPGMSVIAPDITIDYLTVDDDDGNILNGTPHYQEVAIGFGAHNMDPPPLDTVEFQYPSGHPSLAPPGSTTTFAVNVLDIGGAAVPGSGMIHTEIDDEGVVSTPMNEISANAYEATLPPASCESIIRWWISTDTVDSGAVSDPAGAPIGRYETRVASGQTVPFADDFESNQGWTVSGDASDGQWQRGVPVIECIRGNPNEDGDGSGSCYLTDNDQASCNSDVDNGHTILTSPIMDATGDSAVVISYRRWFSNDFGNDPDTETMTVEVSDDNGASWTVIDTVGPAGPEATDGWFDASHDLAEVAGFALNDQFRIRFDVSDLGDGSVVEAGIDGVELTVFSCDGAGCPADLDGSGAVDFGDLLAILSAWGSSGGPADLDGSGSVDFGDLLLVLGTWGPCP